MYHLLLFRIQTRVYSECNSRTLSSIYVLQTIQGIKQEEEGQYVHSKGAISVRYFPHPTDTNTNMKKKHNTNNNFKC